MTTIHAMAEAIIAARPRTVYAILADYREGHPRILPRKYLSNLIVESGGVGAGTVIRFDVHLFGSVRTVRAEISEPVPGRVLVETDVVTGATTSFTVDPANGGNRSKVTIESKWTSPGLRGRIERLLGPRLLHHVYVEELKLLNQVAYNPVGSGPV